MGPVACFGSFVVPNTGNFQFYLFPDVPYRHRIMIVVANFFSVCFPDITDHGVFRCQDSMQRIPCHRTVLVKTHTANVPGWVSEKLNPVQVDQIVFSPEYQEDILYPFHLFNFGMEGLIILPGAGGRNAAAAKKSSVRTVQPDFHGSAGAGGSPEHYRFGCFVPEMNIAVAGIITVPGAAYVFPPVNAVLHHHAFAEAFVKAFRLDSDVRIPRGNFRPGNLFGMIHANAQSIAGSRDNQMNPFSLQCRGNPAFLIPAYFLQSASPAVPYRCIRRFDIRRQDISYRRRPAADLCFLQDPEPGKMGLLRFCGSRGFSPRGRRPGNLRLQSSRFRSLCCHRCQQSHKHGRCQHRCQYSFAA